MQAAEANSRPQQACLVVLEGAKQLKNTFSNISPQDLIYKDIDVHPHFNNGTCYLVTTFYLQVFGYFKIVKSDQNLEHCVCFSRLGKS